jgi:signal transduction histidine kinase
MFLITVAHYALPGSLFLSHEILERLYYLPIVYAAISFGWFGGLVSAVCSGICYTPHIIMAWSSTPQLRAGKYAEIVVFIAVGVTTGVLSDRERRRTRELEQSAAQLRQLYGEIQKSVDYLKRAERLSAVGQLAAGLAHEIRNPLASIEGAIDIVEKTTSGQRRHEFLGIMKKETQRLKRLLTNLLDFARPRAPEMRATQIDFIIDSVLQLTRHTAEQRQIELKTEIAFPLPVLECDAEQIKQVLLNLTLNALQATSAGGRVSLSVRKQNESWLIQVADDGCGIGKAELERIFDPFYTTKEGGTGLGLAVSSQIISQHHGTITAEKNVDKGMTFNVTLPMRQGGVE